MTLGFAPKIMQFNLRRLPVVLVAMLAATPALSFDLTLSVDPAEVTTDHPYRILDLAPGASYDEIAAAATARGIPLYGSVAQSL